MSSNLESLPALGAEGAVHVVVETPRGSSSKFRYDTELAAITLSRPLPAGMTYPADWGFVPSTLAADGDPLDALVIWEGTSYPGVVLQCRLIGALEVEQANAVTRVRERNDRLIAVPLAWPAPSHPVRTGLPVHDPGVWQQFPEPEPAASLMPPLRAGIPSMFDDSGVGQACMGMAGDINGASAPVPDGIGVSHWRVLPLQRDDL